MSNPKLVAGVSVGAFIALIAACTNDFDSTLAANGEPSPAPSSPSEDPKKPPTDNTVDAGNGDGGTQGDAAKQGDGGDAGGLKPNGAPCATESDKSTECQSGFCKDQKSGSKNGRFCTIECDNDDALDPKCAPTPPFTGKCGDGDCIVQ